MQPTEFTIKLGSNLRTLRTNRGWTMDYVAEQMHITPDSVAKYEAGKRMPSVEMLIQAAVLLNCSVLDILRDLDPRRQATSTKELNMLSPDGSHIMNWIATDWDGNVEALVRMIGLIACFPVEIRREIYMDIDHKKDNLLQAGAISADQLPPGLDYMYNELGGLYD